MRSAKPSEASKLTVHNEDGTSSEFSCEMVLENRTTAGYSPTQREFHFLTLHLHLLWSKCGYQTQRLCSTGCCTTRPSGKHHGSRLVWGDQRGLVRGLSYSPPIQAGMAPCPRGLLCGLFAQRLHSLMQKIRAVPADM